MRVPKIFLNQNFALLHLAKCEIDFVLKLTAFTQRKNEKFDGAPCMNGVSKPFTSH